MNNIMNKGVDTSAERNEGNSEKKRVNELVTDAVGVASRAGKKGIELAANGSKLLAGGIAKGVMDISEKAQIDSYNRRIKKFNPLFFEEYSSPDFFVPNIIVIVDDAVRRDIDVCKGAIGWRENKRGTEVLFMYDEFVDKCGLKFIPTAMCDEIYYVDSFDRNCFVKLDYIFQKAHEERLAELEHIAYSLGAKSCSIAIEENQVKHDKKKRNMEIKESKNAVLTENYETESINNISLKRFSKSETKFKGNEEVVAPTLKWYANDNNILNLIEYRCKGGNEITTRTLELSGSSSATMSRKAASSIDAAVTDMGIGYNYAMEDKSIMESTSMIIYHLEF